MTSNITSSPLSTSIGAAAVLASAFSPLSSPSTAANQAIVPSFPSRTVTKRPVEVRSGTRAVKRTRLINEDEDEDSIDGGNDRNNDDGDDDSDDEEEEKLVEGMEGYEKKLKARDDRRFADWVAGKLNEPSVYTVLQAKKTGTKRKTPKAEVNRRLMSAFNKHPPANISFKKVTELQVKNRIDRIRKAFKSAHTLRNSSGFGSQNGDVWRKRVRKKCRHYFVLERNWSKAWAQDVPLYTESLSNKDNAIIAGDLPWRLRKSKRLAVDLAQETCNDTLEPIQDDYNLLKKRMYGEEEEEGDLETHFRNRSTSPSAVASMSATSDPPRSETPGPSRSTLARIITVAPLPDSQSSSSRTANKSAPKSASGGMGHRDFGQLFLKSLEEDEKIAQREMIALKREQFEFYKKDMEDKNAIELKRIQLEEKRMEHEDKRMREQLQLDHDFRLAQLKYESDLQLKLISVNAELRNRGKEPVPATRIQTTSRVPRSNF
ncbi:hypothetical protein EC991_008158 [Linnemannia zychae]|nr:hypothetical protein EC991_008158 [Linnemannia zychae]